MALSGRRVKRHKLKAEINVVPYIDVMLVLLIIFMVTAPMLNSNVDVQLPQANAKSLQDKKHPVIVSVNADGTLGLTMDGSSKETVDEQGMKARVAAIVKENPDVNVLVAGDKNGKYDGVYKVLADLQQAGVAKVGLMSQPDQADGRHGH
ncbi:protein TolR [Frateuria aurantia]